jgi:hypothetical protein
MTTETVTQPDPTTPAAPSYRMPEPDDSSAPPGVGFVGCARRGRLLRVRVASVKRMRMRVECPHGCGEHDTTTPLARALRRDEAEPELVEIPPVEDKPDPDNPTALRGRQQVSDAAIFDAIPEQDTAAIEIARALGYTSGKAAGLIKRIRRINERAEAKGERRPIEITGGAGGAARTGLMLRRSAP